MSLVGYSVPERGKNEPRVLETKLGNPGEKGKDSGHFTAGDGIVTVRTIVYYSNYYHSNYDYYPYDQFGLNNVKHVPKASTSDQAEHTAYGMQIEYRMTRMGNANDCSWRKKTDKDEEEDEDDDDDDD